MTDEKPAAAPTPGTPDGPMDAAEQVVWEWEKAEGESMRDGHATTLARLIRAAIQQAVEEERERLLAHEYIPTFTILGEVCGQRCGRTREAHRG